jgi:hypothetical protein
MTTGHLMRGRAVRKGTERMTEGERGARLAMGFRAWSFMKSALECCAQVLHSSTTLKYCTQVLHSGTALKYCFPVESPWFRMFWGFPCMRCRIS